MIPFRITGLSPAAFAPLFELDDGALAARGAVRYVVDAKPGFPDRVEMRDLEPGERALLVNYVHLDEPSPYRASHAIFVREGAGRAYDRTNEIPGVMRVRTLNLRAFDARHMIVAADLVDGAAAEALIERLFSVPDVAYVHAHYAKRGCFAARIDRVPASG